MFSTRPSRETQRRRHGRRVDLERRRRSACGRGRCASRRRRRAGRRRRPGHRAASGRRGSRGGRRPSSASPARAPTPSSARRPRSTSAEREVGRRVGVDDEPVSLPGDRRQRREPRDVLRRQRGEVRVDAAVELPDVVERGCRRGSSRRAEPVGGEDQRLVVPEQAAHRAAALALEPPHEVDRADAVGAAVDEVAEEPETCVGARPRLRRVEEPGVAEEADEHVAMPVDVAHGEDGRRRAQRVAASVCGAAATIAPRLGDDAAKLADELERLAVLDELLEHGELGLEPVGVDRRPRDAGRSSGAGSAPRSRRRRRAPRGASRRAPGR